MGAVLVSRCDMGEETKGAYRTRGGKSRSWRSDQGRRKSISEKQLEFHRIGYGIREDTRWGWLSGWKGYHCRSRGKQRSRRARGIIFVKSGRAELGEITEILV